MTGLPDQTDVLIIGSGPAGLSAAAALRRLGVSRVHVLEREQVPGGIPRHCTHSPYGMREWGRVMFGPAYARRLASVAQGAGAVIHCSTTVTALHAGGRVTISTPEGVRDIQAKAVLLAMGARETPRAARLVGGSKPGGVLNTGALQQMIALNGHIPFQRPVIVGTELVGFSAFLTCRSAGMRPAAMIEAAARATALRMASLLPRLLGCPVQYNTMLRAVHGRDRVEGITVVTGTTERQIACDGVIFTGQFQPENALLRGDGPGIDPATKGPEIDQYGRLADPAYFAAGNLLRPVETADWCWREGQRVAAAIAAALTVGLPDRAGAVPVQMQGAEVRYILPQVLAAGGGPQAFDRFQLRLTRPYRGDIRINGRRVAVASRPERRILADIHLPPDQT